MSLMTRTLSLTRVQTSSKEKTKKRQNRKGKGNAPNQDFAMPGSSSDPSDIADPGLTEWGPRILPGTHPRIPVRV